jgi:hypothetical protein
MAPTPSAARLADVLGTLSLSTDLAAGVPLETSLRTCAVAARLGRVLGLPSEVVSDGYYAALLRHLGCTAFAHETASSAAGDDHDFLRTFEAIDPLDRMAGARRAVGTLASGKGALARADAGLRTLLRPSLAASLAGAQCEQASTLAGDLGMSEGVVLGLGQIYERHDGRGAPAGLAGEAIERCARLLHVANLVEIQFRHGGRARAVEAPPRGAAARHRRGGRAQRGLGEDAAAQRRRLGARATARIRHRADLAPAAGLRRRGEDRRGAPRAERRHGLSAGRARADRGPRGAPAGVR